MCNCKNIEVGSYGNQVELKPPQHMVEYQRNNGGSDTICVDKCIAGEIKYLWSLGITTTGCCCGHNKGLQYSYIGVDEKDIKRMKEMGYRVHFNPLRPNDEDEFCPKTVLDKEELQLLEDAAIEYVTKINNKPANESWSDTDEKECNAFIAGVQFGVIR